jgi:hypothetical protein
VTDINPEVSESAEYAGPSDRRVIRVRWLRQPAVQLVVGSLAAGAMVLLYPSPNSLLIDLSGPYFWILPAGFTAIAIVVVFSFYFGYVRAVEVTASEIVFAIGAQRVNVAWSSLVPPRGPFVMSINFRYRENGVIQETKTLPVTREMARAILTSPSCPRFSISTEIWKSLQLPAPAERSAV